MSVLAIDQGTSATKAAVISDEGALLALVEVPVHVDYGHDGLVEVDPQALWNSVIQAGQQALALAGGSVTAVGLANQGETVLAWDPVTSAPLTRAIVWQDGRAASVCAGLHEHASQIADRSGLVLDPYFSAPKMTWIREHWTDQGVVTTTDSWLLHRLTGAFVTDVTTASRSLLMNIETLAWDEHLCRHFGIDAAALPVIVDCDAHVGMTSAFGPSLPVVGVMVDQQAALLAQGCVEPGQAKCTFGTGAFLLANAGDSVIRSARGLTTSVAWSTASQRAYCIDGQVFTAAAAVNWLSGLGLLTTASELDSRAAPDTAGVQFTGGLAGLGAPWWRTDARAALTGLTLGTTSGHIIRAVVQAIAAQVADLCQAVAADTGTSITHLRVDGGLSASVTLMQAQADLAQAEIHVYPHAHATAYGVAAMTNAAMRGLPVQPWPWSAQRVYTPNWSAGRAAQVIDLWRQAVRANLPASQEVTT